MAIDINKLSAADAELVRDCELEAKDAVDLRKYLDALVCEGILKAGPHPGGYELVDGQSWPAHADTETLCSLGRDSDYTPYSDDVEENILHRLASSAIDEYGDDDCARSVYQVRVEQIFGSASQRARDFFMQRLSDEGMAA